MTCDETRVLRFLDDDLEAGERTAFDEHLLGCEPCWTSVTEDRRGRALAESLREAPPPGLADRLRLAAEAQRTGRVLQLQGERPRHARLVARVAAGVIVVAAAAGTTIGLASTSGPAPPAALTGASMSATMAAVHLGHGLPMHVAGIAVTVPTELGAPVEMTVSGVDVSVTYYRVGTGEALVVESHRPFAMPSNGTAGTVAGVWTARLEGLTIYCSNGATSAAIVTPMASEAVDLARYLGMPT